MVKLTLSGVLRYAAFGAGVLATVAGLAPTVRSARAEASSAGIVLQSAVLQSDVLQSDVLQSDVLGSDADIRKILAERIDALAGQDDGIGIVVGVVGPQGRRIISYGHLDHGDPRPLDGDTVFEIGSVGKVFTALLLADMVQKGEVGLADPVAKYLPVGVKVPERNGHAITLVDLVTHTSGLPFMPDEIPVVDESAARNYGAPQLYRFLARFQLPRDPGTEWDYSNIDYWLLGQALASRAGIDYQSLLRRRVIAPLKLKSTAFPLPLSPKLKAKLAVGHNAVLQTAPDFYSTSIYAAVGPEAGGLVSTANDLLTFLAAAMGYEASPLAPAMASMLSTRRPIHLGEAQALGWVVSGEGDDQLISHDGGTFGYASSVAWDAKSRVGVVVLSNQVADVSDIARHLLRPNFPLEKPVGTKHTEIALDSDVALDSALLDSYAGRYEVPEEGVFVVVREQNFLTIELPTSWGLPKLRLRPESPRDFFTAELPLRVTFETDKDGRVKGLLLYPPRGQHALAAKKISSDRVGSDR